MHASCPRAAIHLLFASTSFLLVGCASAPSASLPPPPAKCPPAVHEAQPAASPAPKPKETIVRSPEDALARLFPEKRVAAEWFTRSFASAVPPSKVDEIVREMNELGAYSEPGVLNLSTWVENGGKKHCVVTTWNDPKKDVDKSKLFALHASMLKSLR